MVDMVRDWVSITRLAIMEIIFRYMYFLVSMYLSYEEVFILDLLRLQYSGTECSFRRGREYAIPTELSDGLPDCRHCWMLGWKKKLFNF